MRDEKQSTRAQEMRAILERVATQPGMGWVQETFGAVPPESYVNRQRDRLRRALKSAAGPLVERGWTSTGMRTHRVGRDGNLGLIHIESGRWQRPMEFDLYAGVRSKYLAEVLERRPIRPDDRALQNLHHSIAWQFPFSLGQDEVDPPPPMPVPVESAQLRDPVALSPSTAALWLSDTLSRLAATIDAAVDDLPLRDALLRSWPSTDVQARFAALLTWHLRRDEELPAIVAVAAERKEAMDAWERAEGLDVADGDRTRDINQWSHARFVRFLQRCPR
jgi:hypothetical protein